MRAIYILSILFIITLNGCATVEVAKEVTKASNSVKTTIKKITSNNNDVEKNDNKIASDNNDVEKTENLIKEKEEIVIAKKNEEAALNKQKGIAVINIQVKL